MTFEFEKKKKKGVGSTLRDKGIADRLKREKDRFTDAVGANIWTCLCFKRQEHKDEFLRITGLPDRRFVTEDELKAATERFKPEKRLRSFAKKPRGAIKVADPWSDVPETDSLEHDCLAEAEALLSAFKNVETFDSYREASDSHIWICAVFANQRAIEAYLDDMNLRKYGDKYIDASAWLSELR